MYKYDCHKCRVIPESKIHRNELGVIMTVDCVIPKEGIFYASVIYSDRPVDTCMAGHDLNEQLRLF